MKQFLFIDPISSEKELHCERDIIGFDDSDCLHEKTTFMKNLGLQKWQVWHQFGPKSIDFCIHFVECLDLEPFFRTFQEQVRMKNPYAVPWNEWLLKTFGVDVSIKAYPKTQKVLELDFEDTHKIDTNYPFCYVLPLLPGHLDAHLQYCHEAMNEKKESIKAACKAFGMHSLHKWIEEVNGHNYVLYYQEMSLPSEEARNRFIKLKNEPKALAATQMLREQTGLQFEELSPQVQCVHIIK